MTQSLIAFAALHVATVVILLAFAALETTRSGPQHRSRRKLETKPVARLRGSTTGHPGSRTTGQRRPHARLPRRPDVGKAFATHMGAQR
jgi:hypothetical protein